MKKLIYLFTALMISLSACEENRKTNQQNEDLGEGISSTRENIDNIFSTTYEDLREEKMEKEKELNELKRERNERGGLNVVAFDSLVNNIEEKVKLLETKAEEFKTAGDDRKDQIKEEFDRIEDEIEEKLDEVKDRFEKKD